jgi:RNase P/RNase MRP subunit POP5
MRQRYIGFVIKYSNNDFIINRYDFIGKLKNECNKIFNKNCVDMGIYLTRFDGKKGILKCNHIEKDNTIRLLRSINKIKSKKVEIITIKTSGTIKALSNKFMIGFMIY